MEHVLQDVVVPHEFTEQLPVELNLGTQQRPAGAGNETLGEAPPGAARYRQSEVGVGPHRTVPNRSGCWTRHRLFLPGWLRPPTGVRRERSLTCRIRAMPRPARICRTTSSARPTTDVATGSAPRGRSRRASGRAAALAPLRSDAPPPLVARRDDPGGFFARHVGDDRPRRLASRRDRLHVGGVGGGARTNATGARTRRSARSSPTRSSSAGTSPVRRDSTDATSRARPSTAGSRRAHRGTPSALLAPVASAPRPRSTSVGSRRHYPAGRAEAVRGSLATTTSP